MGALGTCPFPGLSPPRGKASPAASPPVGLGSLLLLGFLVQLGQDEAVPALDQPAQVHLPRSLV